MSIPSVLTVLGILSINLLHVKSTGYLQGFEKSRQTIKAAFVQGNALD
jgi:hypothetical protein